MSLEGQETRSVSVRLGELQERLRFIDLSDDEIALLRELRPLVEEHSEAIVEVFYRHLLRFEPMRRLLGDDAQVARLKTFQKQYLISLTQGRFDADYVEDRLHIGRVHERIGLTPQWYLGAYTIFLEQLAGIIDSHHAGRPERARRVCVALTKVLNLDAQIVLDAYFAASQQRAVGKAEQLAAVGEMAASIAHEVRNPLAGMKGAMDLLRADIVADPRKVEIVDEFLAQISRLENLVRDLLSYARPHHRGLEHVAVHALLDKVLRLAVGEPQGQSVSLIRHFGAVADQVQADPQQLEQVFLNLAQNAAQAMDRGGTLTVSTAAADGMVSVEFVDTGKGISPADMPRIFQPFFTTRHRGSGLGLAIVRKILDAHGGSVEVESTAGRGTTARVCLQLAGQT